LEGKNHHKDREGFQQVGGDDFFWKRGSKDNNRTLTEKDIGHRRRGGRKKGIFLVIR